MKLQSLIMGILIGVAGSFFLTKPFTSKANNRGLQSASKWEKKDSAKWIWSDSLDAVKMAPQNHHIVFENEKIRILEVILRPYEFETMHTHKYPSVMFGSANASIITGEKGKSHYDPQFDIMYYKMGYDSIKNVYYTKDSVRQHNAGGIIKEEFETGNYHSPEGPHKIHNLSDVTIDVFRVEIKPDVKTSSD